VILVGLPLALGSAAALNWSFFAQHAAAAALPRLQVRRPLRSLGILLSNRRWLAGFATGLGGWALYVVALAVAPLSLVQAVSAGGIGLLALLVHTRSSSGLSRTEWKGVWLSVGGLFLLGISLAGASGAGNRPSPVAVGCFIGVSAATAAVAAVVGRERRMLAAGAGLGLAAGVLYAAGDVATKAAVGGDVLVVFVLAVLAAHGLAFVALQLGFQRGGALATAGVSTLMTNAIPIVAGATLFGESLPAGPLGAVRVVAFAAVVAGALFFVTPRNRAEDASYRQELDTPRDCRLPALVERGPGTPGGAAAGLDAGAHRA